MADKIYETSPQGLMCGCGSSCTAGCKTSCTGTAMSTSKVRENKVVTSDIIQTKYLGYKIKNKE